MVLFLLYTATSTCTDMRFISMLTSYFLKRFVGTFLVLALVIQRYSLCPHRAYSYRLTATPKQTHAAKDTPASTAVTAPTATTNVKPLCGVHRTQWGNKHWNHTTSTQYLLIPSSSPLSPPLNMGIHFTVADSSYHVWSVWGTIILQGHMSRHSVYPPQTDHDTLISITSTFLPLQHISRGLRIHHFWHDTLMMRAGVRCVWSFVITPPSPWDVTAITQPQGATEEISDTLILTREQMTPHTGAINKKLRPLAFSDANTSRLSTWVCGLPLRSLSFPVPNTIWQHTELSTHGNTQSWTSTTAHHHANIPDDLFSSTSCLFTLQLADSI